MPILETRVPPVYQRIAVKAQHLHDLGLNQTKIWRRLGAYRWAAGKARRWLEDQE
jgi:hypothetical protein